MNMIKIVTTVLFYGYALLAAPVTATSAEIPGTPQAAESGIVSFFITVAIPEAPVFAGPGNDMYVTGKLAQNEQVEIFMRRRDGWCAIRPPEGSFSWINANFVRRENDQLGTVVNNEAGKEVPVRVGADSVVKSTVIQLGLKNGKQVHILGETKLPGGTSWFKIVPPAGEFRWIHDKSLVKDETIHQLPARLMMAQEYLDTIQSEQVNVSVPKLESKPALRAGQSALSVKESNSNASAPLAEPEKSDGQKLRMLSMPLNIPPMATGSPPAQMDEFSLEIARLNRDLFDLINGQGNRESVELLSTRAKALFTAASDDQQRLAAKNIYDQIEQFKLGVGSNEGMNPERSGAQGAVSAGQKKDTRFIKPRQRVVRPEKSDDPHRMEFAFGGQNNPFRTTHEKSGLPDPQTRNGARASGRAGGRGTPLFGSPSGPTTVPPPDYHIATPVTSPQSESKQSSGQKQAFLTDGKKIVLPGPVLDSPASIKQVTAVVPADLPTPIATQAGAAVVPKRPDITTWQPPVDLAGKKSDSRVAGASPTSPRFVPISPTESSSQGFDAMGILGHLPSRPQGYPPYVLVEKKGNGMNIICYVHAESGQSLDRFVGKMIGVKGTRGWLKGENENRMVITAKTIFTIK